MTYVINKYNGDQVTVVADGTTDITLDIKLVGKNYAGYGEIQNENFVFLLENFSNISAPPRPITGQLWFDNGTKKLKFYDSIKWRTAGGAEIGDTAPSGLSNGDFWFDTQNKQLNAWDASTQKYVLIGPQAAGSDITEMRSKNVQDTLGNSHAIIEAIVNGVTVYIISSDAEFTLDNNVNAIAGYSKIEKGLTLRNTPGIGDVHEGQTQTDFRFWGTATNADRLGGYPASDYTRSGNATFNELVNFSDRGFTVGDPNKRLRVFNDGEAIPTIYNQLSDTIVFKTTISGNVSKTPLVLSGSNILPGENGVSNIGSDPSISGGKAFANIYANSFIGTVTKSDSLKVIPSSGSNYYSNATIDIGSGTIVARTNYDQVINGTNVTAGSIKATYFVGTATAAYYADLAEKYLTDKEYEIGTVVMVGGDLEVTECQAGYRALGTVSENPAYMMNSDLDGGTYIALKGRVPVKVLGKVSKGDRLVAGKNGVAVVSAYANDVFAIALESNDSNAIKIIEAVIL